MANKNKVAKQGRRNANRPRPLPPDVTARNLAYEKQRRQTFNDDLVNLARLVPTLAQARRLSKVLIVNESIRHLRQRRSLCISAARDVQGLLTENSRLVSELNMLRTQIGGPAMPRVEPRPATEAIVQLMDIENEEAGVFPEGFGLSWAGRSSPPSNKATQSQGKAPSAPESTSPEMNGHHATHTFVQEGNASIGFSDTTISNPEQPLAMNCDGIPSAGSQTEFSLSSTSDLFGPTDPVPVNDVPHIPGYLDTPLDALSMDPLPESWVESFDPDHQDPGNTSRLQQTVNNFEDLWNFWVRPEACTS